MFHFRITDADICGGPANRLRRVSRQGARGVVLDERNRVLILHMGANGFDKLPGGGIEGRETPEEAFAREALEETGYHIRVVCKLGIVEEHKYRTGYFQYSHCFFARLRSDLPREAPKLTAGEATLGFSPAWISLSEARARVNQAFSACGDYKMRFMLLREKTILEHLPPELEESKDEPDPRG